MLKKLSSTKYQISVTQEDKVIIGRIVETLTGKVKEYRQSFGTTNGLMNHLNSLTDDQIKDIFKEKK